MSFPPGYNTGTDDVDGTDSSPSYNHRHEYPPPSSAYNGYYGLAPPPAQTWQERFYSSNAFANTPPSSSPSPARTSQLYSQPPYPDLRPSSPPRAPYIDRDRARSRSTTPPPSGSPTPSYLTLSLDPSDSLPAPTRKLLVLDLNGSLLLRSPRPPFSARRAANPTTPAQRTVHSRPYLGVLRQFLFHEDTRRWLDVMVWSSAQPHNVDDMVQKSFGEDRRSLVAVWARDTLGLAQNNYHRKVQTVKDLKKPWAALSSLLKKSSSEPLPLPASPASSHSSIASSSPSTPPATSSSSLSSPTAPSSQPLPTEASTPTIHSALTTILLDDSPLKAVLQPYNHLCLPEYTSKRRNVDLAIIQRQKENELGDYEKKRRRQEKKAHKMAARKMNGGEERDPARERDSESPSAESVLSLATPEDEVAPEAEIDSTLLAVIGILHAARLQSNVAGWIRGGGLWPTGRGKALAGSQAGNDAEHAAVADGHSKMWFEDAETMAHWTEQGRRAVEELGIPVEHGIER